MFIADFHIHSKYSRATSKACVPEVLELWARRKGLNLIGTGDFTHALWRGELREKLVPAEEGLYTLKDECRLPDEWTNTPGSPRFLVTGEISSIYKKNGKVRKVHNLILLPSLEAAETLSRRLETVGNLHSDGRPILGLDSRDLLEITLEIVPDAIFIPAHIWTPHFSLFGEYSGFDGIRECFEDLTGHIHSLETGLSSDPPMNWRVSALDPYTLVSNSDAHSPAKLAREANLFDTGLSYPEIARALDKRSDGFLGTLEFFPQEGKYHYDGHRNCGVCQKPSETIAAAGICPVCGRRITVGVLHRVEELADREEGFVPPVAKRFESLIPLREVVACSAGLSAASKKVEAQYFSILRSIGPELYVLRQAPLDDIARKAGPLVAEGVRRLRGGNVEIEPGYDGAYGRIKLFGQGELRLFSARSCVPGTAVPPSPDAKGHAETAAVREAASGGEAAHAPSENIPYGLNQEQWDAVCAEDSAVAVVAGPGTGKTKTLVGRIAYLAETRGVAPEGITAVTFTNKAASEMQERLKRHFSDGRAAARMTIGTFQSICLKFLQAGDPGITVIDEQTALETMNDVLKRLGAKGSARAMLHAVSLVKSGAALEEPAEVPPQVFEAYQAALERYGAMDFDDILLRALERLESGGLEEAPRFEHILVDEFQDINPVQYRLIRAWCSKGANLFVIGDPDQSIYGFRGTDPRCFEKFFADFPAARRIHLARNYRSTPEILACAQSVFTDGVSEARALCATRKSGASVRLFKANDAFSEALFVAKEINRMVGGMDMLQAHASPASGAKQSKWGFGDIAVLYRTNRQAGVLEDCLLKEDIPYVVSGRHGFLSDPQVKKTLSFFRFLLQPSDTASLKAYLEACALPAERARRIVSDYTASGGRTLTGLSTAFEQSAPDLISGLPLSFEALSKYARAVKKEKPCTLIENWARDNAFSGERSMDLLINTSVTYGDMASFLRSLTLGQERDVTRSGKRQYSPDAVSLLTLHSSKGLEYPVVFICGVSDGLIPFRKPSGECDIGEERRLFFVGMTRAQDELVLLRSPAGSPFLSALPEQYLVTGDALPSRPKPEAKQLSLF